MKKYGKIDGTVYLITNKITQKEYVGITIFPVEKRIDEHITLTNSGTLYLSKSIEKYGKNKFKYRIIDKSDSTEKLGKKEKYWIKKLKTLAPNGYNATPGGYGGIGANHKEVRCLNNGKIYRSASEASRELSIPVHGISDNCTGKIDGTKGYVFVFMNETFRKRAEKIRNKRYKENFNKNSGPNGVRCLNNGITYTSIKKAAKDLELPYSTLVACLYSGRKELMGYKFEYTSKDKKKLVKDKRENKLEKLDESKKAFIKKRSRPVICIETNVVFESIRAASRYFGLARSNLRRHLLGNPKNKHWGGLTFEYVNKGEENGK